MSTQAEDDLRREYDVPQENFQDYQPSSPISRRKPRNTASHINMAIDENYEAPWPEKFSLLTSSERSANRIDHRSNEEYRESIKSIHAQLEALVTSRLADGGPASMDLIDDLINKFTSDKTREKVGSRFQRADRAREVALEAQQTLRTEFNEERVKLRDDATKEAKNGLRIELNREHQDAINNLQTKHDEATRKATEKHQGDIVDLKEKFEKEKRALADEIEKLKRQMKKQEEDYDEQRDIAVRAHTSAIDGLRQQLQQSTSAAADANTKHTQAQKTINTRDATIREQKKTIKEQDDTINHQGTTITALEGTVDGCNKTIADLRAAVKDHEDANTKHAEDIKQKDATINHQSNAIATLQANVGNLQSDVDNLRISKEAREDTIKEYNQAIKDHEATINTQRSNINTLDGKNRELKDEMLRITNQHSATLANLSTGIRTTADSLQSGDALREELRQANTRLRETNDGLQETDKELRTKIRELEQAKQTCEQGNEELDKANKKLEQSHARLEQINQNLETEQTTLKGEHKELKVRQEICYGELKLLREAKEALDKEHETLKSSSATTCDELSKLIGSNEQLNDAHQKLISSKIQLDKEHGELRNARDQNAKALHDLEISHAQVDDQKKSLETLLQNHNNAESERAQSLIKAQKEATVLKNQLKEKERAYKELQDELDMSETKKSNLELSKRTVTSERNLLQSRLDQKGKELDKANDRLKRTKKTFEGQLADANNRVTQLRDEHSHAQQEYEAKLNDLEFEVDDLDSRLADSMDANGAWEAAFRDAEEHIATQQATIEHCDRNNEKIAQYHQRIQQNESKVLQPVLDLVEYYRGIHATEREAREKLETLLFEVHAEYHTMLKEQLTAAQDVRDSVVEGGFAMD